MAGIAAKQRALARYADMQRGIPPQAMNRGESPHPEAREEEGGFREFSASALYCPKCKQAMPVREVLLLVTPSGNVYDYRCAQCGTSVGTKR